MVIASILKLQPWVKHKHRNTQILQSIYFLTREHEILYWVEVKIDKHKILPNHVLCPLSTNRETKAQ